jgi:hypothetical protein
VRDDNRDYYFSLSLHELLEDVDINSPEIIGKILSRQYRDIFHRKLMNADAERIASTGARQSGLEINFAQNLRKIPSLHRYYLNLALGFNWFLF